MGTDTRHYNGTGAEVNGSNPDRKATQISVVHLSATESLITV